MKTNKIIFFSQSLIKKIILLTILLSFLVLAAVGCSQSEVSLKYEVYIAINTDSKPEIETGINFLYDIAKKVKAKTKFTIVIISSNTFEVPYSNEKISNQTFKKIVKDLKHKSEQIKTNDIIPSNNQNIVKVFHKLNKLTIDSFKKNYSEFHAYIILSGIIDETLHDEVTQTINQLTEESNVSPEKVYINLIVNQKYREKTVSILKNIQMNYAASMDNRQEIKILIDRL